MTAANERIAQLQLKLKQLEQKRDQLIQVARREELVKLERTRRDESRRKYLIGSIILEKIKTGKIDGARFFASMVSTLERGDDRRLFECSQAEYLRAHQLADKVLATPRYPD